VSVKKKDKLVSILKKYWKHIVISLCVCLALYGLIMINVINTPLRGSITMPAESVRECYDILNERFTSDENCWTNLRKDLTWSLEKVWEEDGCPPCHQQNTLFQHCLDQLDPPVSYKTRLGSCSRIIHIFSRVEGQDIDVWGADWNISFGDNIYGSAKCGHRYGK